MQQVPVVIDDANDIDGQKLGFVLGLVLASFPLGNTAIGSIKVPDLGIVCLDERSHVKRGG
jgi:hypothetical protein